MFFFHLKKRRLFCRKGILALNKFQLQFNDFIMRTVCGICETGNRSIITNKVNVFAVKTNIDKDKAMSL